MVFRIESLNEPVDIGMSSCFKILTSSPSSLRSLGFIAFLVMIFAAKNFPSDFLCTFLTTAKFPRPSLFKIT